MKRKQTVSREWLAEAGTFKPTTHKGYLITFSDIQNMYYISKGGHHISSAQTLTQAKSDIDLIATPGNNPARRKGTSKPRRASQITGKPPTKRLVKRRMANTDAGYFPNPTWNDYKHVKGEIFHGGAVCVQLRAPNNSSGNPRRLFVVLAPTSQGGKILAVVEEGYSGFSAVNTAGFKDVTGASMVIDVSPAQYTQTKKYAMNLGVYHESY